MNRIELAEVLEHQGYFKASDRIVAGEDPIRVLNDYRPFIGRYEDGPSRVALSLFQAIVAGETVID